MKVPYCICDKQAKETFSTGFLIVGFAVYFVLSIILLSISLMGDFDVILFLLLAILWGWLGWTKFEYKRQALFLGHSQKCARRYSAIAAFASTKAYDPSYSKLKGYKSAIETTAERLLGKRRAGKMFETLAVLGTLALVLFMFYMSYDGLTRQRHGLPNEYTKYEPGVTEAFFLAMGLLFGALMIFLSFEKKSKNKLLLAISLITGGLLTWMGIVYAIYWYARMSFMSIIENFSLILLVIAFLVAIGMITEKLWRKRKKRKRRRKR